MKYYWNERSCLLSTDIDDIGEGSESNEGFGGDSLS
jgi:hypothetical protein